MSLSVRRLDPSLREDFYRLHSDENGCGHCQCVAWWVPTWEGWPDRTAESNRRLRDDLFERGEYDGYLLVRDRAPVGWAQVGRRDRLEKLIRDYQIDPDPGAWAITCLLLAPQVRGQGWARRLLEDILADLPDRGAESVEAYPRRGDDLPAEEIWTGSERLFIGLGFERIQDHPRRPRYRRRLLTAGLEPRRV